LKVALAIVRGDQPHRTVTRYTWRAYVAFKLENECTPEMELHSEMDHSW